MADQLLAATLEHEHQDVDRDIEAFADGPNSRERDAAPLRGALAALRRHIYAEEQLLFPPLREQGMLAPVLVMLREHGQLWDTMDALERELQAGAIPAALQLCHELLVQLQHHNPKEERILYPQSDIALSPEQAAELAAFLRDGTLPDGWICAKAAN
ncbi:MAG: hemerythrin domain-containing protein [Trebonia sp.]